MTSLFFSSFIHTLLCRCRPYRIFALLNNNCLLCGFFLYFVSSGILRVKRKAKWKVLHNGQSEKVIFLRDFWFNCIYVFVRVRVRLHFHGFLWSHHVGCYHSWDCSKSSVVAVAFDFFFSLHFRLRSLISFMVIVSYVFIFFSFALFCTLNVSM